MAVYYYNGSPIATPLTISSNEPTFDADTVSLSKRRASQGAQRWELAFNIITDNNAVELFMSSITGASGFDQAGTMIMPQLVDVTLSGTINTNGSFTSYVSQIGIDKSSGTPTGIIKRGYFIKFGNHSKIYVITEDCDLSVASPILKFFPTYRYTTNNNATTVSYGSASQITYWRDISNTRGITFTDGVLSSPGTINLVENI